MIDTILYSALWYIFGIVTVHFGVTEELSMFGKYLEKCGVE